MGEDIEYRQVNIPDSSPEAFSYVERRAEILHKIERAGHPGALNKSELAREYDVSHTSIGRDFDALAEYYADNLGKKSAMLTETAYQKSIRELQAQGKFYKAAKVLEMWNNWLFDRGAQEREPARSEIDMDMQSRHAEVAYHVVRGDDGEPAPLPQTDAGAVDYAAIGFSASPGSEDSDS